MSRILRDFRQIFTEIILDKRLPPPPVTCRALSPHLNSLALEGAMRKVLVMVFAFAVALAV
jgi:hypothetical protein